MVLPGSGTREAKATAERLREAVSEAIFTCEGGQKVGVTISVGIAAYDPRRSRSSAQRAPAAAELFRRADAAVYRAKESGRNRVVAWSGRGSRKAPSPSGRGASQRKKTARVVVGARPQGSARSATTSRRLTAVRRDSSALSARNLKSA